MRATDRLEMLAREAEENADPIALAAFREEAVHQIEVLQAAARQLQRDGARNPEHISGPLARVMAGVEPMREAT